MKPASPLKAFPQTLLEDSCTLCTPVQPIVFIGPMGVGKTTVGKRLARLLHMDFADTDKEIQKNHGPVSDFFTNVGEDAFRECEAQIVRETLAAGAGIVSLGGGAVLHEGTRKLLQKLPVVLILSTQEAVLGRLSESGIRKRPLLHQNPQRWGEILQARLPIYRELAKLTVYSNRHSVDALVRLCAEWVLVQNFEQIIAGAKTASSLRPQELRQLSALHEMCELLERRRTKPRTHTKKCDCVRTEQRLDRVLENLRTMQGGNCGETN